MKHTARARKPRHKPVSRRVSKKQIITPKTLVFGVLALVAFIAGLFLLTNPFYPKAEALTPTSNISVNIVKPEHGDILTRQSNPLTISATSNTWITRYDFFVDDVFQGSFVKEMKPLVTPTPSPDGLFHIDVTNSTIFQTQKFPEGKFYNLKVRAIDKNLNYADSVPIQVWVRNGLDNVITPTMSVGTPSANFIQNPGFEIDNNLDTFPDLWGSAKYFTRTKSVVHSGAYAGMHSGTAGSPYGISQKFWGIVGGKKYNFSQWIYIPTTMRNFHYSMRLHWKKADDEHISLVIPKRIGNATNGWVELKDTVTAPPKAAAVIVEMRVENLNGTVYVDDLEFKAL